MASNGFQKRADRYRLHNREGQPIRLQRDWWCMEGIYLSDISLAVALAPCHPAGRATWEPEAAKQELYRLLRWVGHLAYDHDLMRPVAGVGLHANFNAFGQEVAGAVQAWCGQQEWHRGAFTLYVEDGISREDQSPVYKRLADLLEPTPEVLDTYEPKDARDTQQLFTDIEKAMQRSGLDEETKKLARELFDSLTTWVRSTEAPATTRTDLEESGIARFAEQASRKAQELAEGSET